jgi:multidrug efflux pump subunit AcrA (membrane-fusion protein)
VLPEMSAKVHFISKISSDSLDIQPILVVDSSAITKRKNDLVVFLLKDRIVEEVPITVGRTLGKMVEIKSGLSSGDRVVLKPSKNIQSGTSVKLKQ